MRGLVIIQWNILYKKMYMVFLFIVLEIVTQLWIDLNRDLFSNLLLEKKTEKGQCCDIG